jgi:hypothetical protein
MENGYLTSNNAMQATPPSTSFETHVARALSTKRSVFAMHRRASDEASGSSSEVDNERSIDKLAGVERTSEPDGCFPRVFKANKAREASKERESKRSAIESIYRTNLEL